MPTPSSNAVLITGAAQRIGRALALDFAEQGWRVGIHYARSRSAAEQLAAQIENAGGRAAAVAADLADEGAVTSLVARTQSALGTPLTCLINNASLFEADEATTMTPAGFDRHIAVNLKAPLLLAQALHQHLPVAATGNVINIIDQRVWRPTPDFFSYTLAKSALLSATRTLAQAFAPRVRVNGIGPGPVLQSIYQTAEEFADEARSTPLGHGTSPAEIAAAIRFILGAPALTGQMIALDGGQHLEWRTNLPAAGGRGRMP